jgi:hypothetical protein
MKNSEKFLNLLSNFVETGILTSQDAKKELIDKFKLVSRDEFNVLKKIIEKQQKQINLLKKSRKPTRAKKF